MGMSKLTKRTVDAAKVKDTDYFVWDDDLPGFGLRVFASGRKSYVIQYRSHGRTRRFTIGPHGPVTPNGARKKALILLGRIADGGDPAEEKTAARRDPTVGELCDLYLEEGCATKKPSTIATDRGRVERHIKPLLGKRRVRSVKRADIQKFLNDVATGKTKTDEKTGKHGRAIVRGGKGTATRTVGLLGGIFSFAVDKGLRPDNPAQGVKRFPDKKHERFLSTEEFARLGQALSRAEDEELNPSAIGAIRLLILTGCRKSEILGLQWENIDWDHSCLRLPDSKTGQKIVPLGAPALKVLSALSRLEGCPYVLIGAKLDRPYSGLQKVWNKIRKWAALDEVRVHDLRHSFASTGILGGHSLFVLGQLLGHKDPKTTQIYAHLADDTLRQVADRIANQIDAAMKSGQQVSEFLPFTKSKT